MKTLPDILPNLPRYTSYPTAPHFSSAAAPAARERFLDCVKQANEVSVYIHIPFCDRLCWFCGCHTKHTLKYQPVSRYVESLVEEIRQFSEKLGYRPVLKHLHFGGGSPSMLQPSDAIKINTALHSAFDYLSDAEISIEVDPNDAGDAMYETCQILGMTRASLGVQDFEQSVQDAINRPQSFEDTKSVIDNLRRVGISSVNIDMLYGLPLQTAETVAATARKVLEIMPDRISLFGYAHVPHLKKHQRLIPTESLPDDAQRLLQMRTAKSIFLKDGLEAIGIDHFARKNDALAIAKRNKKLRRNFQGYTTDTASVLIGFGASAISSSESTYLQNTVATGTYQLKVANNQPTSERGMVLSLDDQIRSFMIQSLMCNFELDIRELQLQFGDVAKNYVEEIYDVAHNNEYGLFDFADEKLTILHGHQEYVRLVAAKFDAYLESGASTYSKAV